MVSIHDLIAYMLRAEGHMASMKIHKLCYYLQGYHLAWTGKPLFAERIEARNTGPVVPFLYSFLEKEPIPKRWRLGRPDKIDKPTTQIIDAILPFYASSSGLHLAELAREEAPWLRTREKATEENSHPEITHELMTAFFRALTDAPDDRLAYANRFIDQYASEGEVA